MTEDSARPAASGRNSGFGGIPGAEPRPSEKAPDKRPLIPGPLPTCPWAVGALVLLCLFVYWPALDNGFISDDYIFLERIDTWSGNPFYLFQIPPENYRTTTYAAFWMLQRLFGYQPVYFYLFTLLVHAVNGALLGKLTGILLDNRKFGWISALVFVSFQSPQEAILWLGAMHEALQGLGILLTILFWVKGREKAALSCYLLSLFSKESALIALVLLVLVDFWRSGSLRWKNSYLLFLVPTFGLVLMLTLQGVNNSLVVGGFYKIGWHALSVWVLSLHRLAFPWFYLLVILAFASGYRKLAELVPPLLWVAISLAPYVFLTYQNHIPSRHTYLASMGLAMALSLLLAGLGGRRATVLLLVFLVVNAGYIWFRKDSQYEERAAPTQALVQKLAAGPVRTVVILNFPLNPWIAKMTARTVPGWDPSRLLLPGIDHECQDCPTWEWNPAARTYRCSDGR